MKKNNKLLYVFLLVVSFGFVSYVLKTSFAVPTDWYNDFQVTWDEDNLTITLERYNNTEATEVYVPAKAVKDSKNYSVIVKGGTAGNGLFSNRTNLTKITFENGVKGADTLNYLFSGCTNLEEIIFNNFDTSATTSMAAMFRNCSKLTSIDLSSFNTSNVTSMNRMFQDCTNLASLDLSNFNTSNVTSMAFMFTSCNSLKTLDLSNFRTSNVTSMERIFSYMPNLTYLDMSGFTSESLQSIYYGFYDTPKLKKIKLGHFNFLYTDSEHHKNVNNKNAYPFGRGTWKRLENGQSVSIVDVIYESGWKDISGTYQWQSNIINEMNVGYPVTYRIERLKKVDEYSFSNNDLFTIENNVLYAKNLNKVAQEDYVVPGSATLLFKDVVTDVNHNHYNLRLTVDNIHIYDLDKDYSSDNNEITNFYHSITGPSGSLMFRSYNYADDLSTKIFGNRPAKYDAKLQVVDNNGVVQQGSFIFSATDLDISSYKDGQIVTDENHRSPVETHAWGTYSEGINLIEGYDESTIKRYTNSVLEWDNVNKRIFGIRDDEGTEFSEFSVKADASGFKFTWTGEECGTSVLGYYQPLFVDIIKQDNHGNNLPGAKLKLYFGDTLIDSWISTNEAHTLFLNAGIYTLKEDADGVPSNYVKADDIVFYVDFDGKLIVDNETKENIIMNDVGKSVRVIVKYIDETSNTEFENARITDNSHKYGDSYTSQSKSFAGYVLTRKPTSETVVLNKDETVLTYYYKKVSGGVLEKHIDILNNNVLYNETHSGNVGDEYNIPSKTFDNYELVTDQLPNNSTGTMKEEPIEVVYYYKKKAKVVIKYIDKVTNEEISDEDILNGYVDDDYDSSHKKIKSYIYIESAGDPSGKMSVDDKEVIYYYQRVVYVTTEVAGDGGGTITGDETVYYQEDSTPDKIIIEADKDHYIDKVTINGKEITITNDSKMILANFNNMEEDKHVIVEFKSLTKNVPKTDIYTVLPFIGIITLIIGLVFVGLSYKRKKNNI